MSGHALLSPSSAYRWIACTPSARLGEMIPEPKRRGGFDHAMNGTTAHTYAEAQLRRHYKQITAAEYNEAVNAVKETEYYNDEFESYVAQYVLYVRSQIGAQDEPHFEVKVDYSEWVTGGTGTSDVVVIREDTIHVMDAKFGVMRVDAKENEQMRLYALGSYAKFKDTHPHLKNVVCTIVQPRIDNVSTEELTLAELIQWADDVVRPAAKLAYAGKGEFFAGSHCQFCKAKSQCRARADFNNVAAAADFKAPALLSETELMKILSDAAKTRKWLSDVEEYMLTQATDHGIVPTGYELGQTSTNRKIEAQEDAAKKLQKAGFDDIFTTPSLKSVAQLEKQVGKGHLQDILGDLIVKPAGEPKLVPSKAREDFA